MSLVATALVGAGLCVGVGALVALHVLPTGLDPRRSAVSQYGISRYAVWYRVQTLAYAVAGAGAAIDVSELRGGGAGSVVVLCAAFAVARGAISWFPMDAPGAAPTSKGAGHRILALVAFVGIALAAWRLATVLHAEGTHAALATGSEVLAVLMTATLVALPLSRQGGWFGLTERGFYLCMTAWLLCVSIAFA